MKNNSTFPDKGLPIFTHKEGNYLLEVFESIPYPKHGYIDTENLNKETGYYKRVEIKEPMHDVRATYKGRAVSYFNLCAIRESEFSTTKERLLNSFNEAIIRNNKDRLERIIKKREEIRLSKLFPIKTTYKCNNIDIIILESFKSIEKKQVDLYFGAKTMRGFSCDIDYEVTFDNVLEELHKGQLFDNRLDIPSGVENHEIVKDINILPMAAFLGLIVKFRGEIICVQNLDFEWTNIDFLEYEIVGELEGASALAAMINKLKYVE